MLWRPSLCLHACFWSEFWVRCLPPSEAGSLARPGLSRGCPASSQSALLQSSPGLRHTRITHYQPRRLAPMGFDPGVRNTHVHVTGARTDPSLWSTARIGLYSEDGDPREIYRGPKWRHADAVITSVSGLSKQKIGSERGHCHCHVFSSNTDANIFI